MVDRLKPGIFLREERGFASVMLALSLVAMLSFAALVIDLGLLALNRQQLINAVDAAALAGAMELPDNPERARNTAIDYARMNGATGPVEAEVRADGNSLAVSAGKEVNYFLARLMGFTRGEARAEAVAVVAGIKAVRGAAPLAVPEQEFQFGIKYILKLGAGQDSPLGPGTFSALSLGGTGASNYEENLKNGYQGRLAAGDVINTETGNISNPTRRAIEYRIELELSQHSPPCTPEHYVPGCPRILIIPVYETASIQDGQVKSIIVSGFAAFLVERVRGQGNENFIEGYFIRTVVAGEGDPAQQNYGLQGVKLVR
ncbi:pilus assembly protein TadG-related protein [Moorella sulfitireducens]|uniref:pilus assembly protein TadG-related protein n=1 Tax=Neomoorella sulfitireducens TaxID=2972948 RepID=UPI0021ABE816|nr:pilus assembly protein TadG-related protein [Moorella sulfitireducens]